MEDCKRPKKSAPQNQSESLTTGFPSPANDYREDVLDFNAYLVKNYAATFIVRLEGSLYDEIGLHSGDILVVDRSLTPKRGDMVIVVAQGEFRIAYFDTIIPDEDTLIWGVVNYSVHHWRQ